MMKPRIAVVVGQYPQVELERRRVKILSYRGAHVDVGVIVIEPTPYQLGFGGAGTEAVDRYYVEAFRRAQDAGYDAVVPLGVLDIGVDAGANAVRIPVVGPLRASLQVASHLGRRAGLIAYSANLIPTIADLVGRYGLAQQVCGYADVGTDLTELASVRDQLHARFVEAARRLRRDQGADVIVSAGISLCPIHLEREQLEADLGVRVVEAIGAPIELAATLARMGYGRGASRT